MAASDMPSATAAGQVEIEVVAWISKFVGGDGSQLLGTRFGVLLGHLNWNSGINRPRNFDFLLNINRFAGADSLREAQLVSG